MPPAGSDTMAIAMITPSDLLGHKIQAVSGVVHYFDEKPTGDANPVCLTLDGLGPVSFRCSDEGSVDIAVEDLANVDMAESGALRVEPPTLGSVLAKTEGQVIVNVSTLVNQEPSFQIGLLLGLGDGSALAIANVGDQLLCQSWPSTRWRELGISTEG